MNALVEIVNNEIVTSSRRVAEVFGKEHCNVIKSIEKLLEQAGDDVKINAVKNMFCIMSYMDLHGEERKEYSMNRDGFSLLVMGFTGEKALKWKIEYIRAFNDMENIVRQAVVASEKPRLNNPANDAVTDVENASATIERLFKAKHGMAIAAAMEIVGNTHAVDLSPLRPLLPPADNPGFLNPTTTGERLGGLKPSTVNKMLLGLGLQYKSEKGWRLTEDGFLYGEEKPYTRNGHSGYQIAWSEKVMGVLK